MLYKVFQVQAFLYGTGQLYVASLVPDIPIYVIL